MVFAQNLIFDFNNVKGTKCTLMFLSSPNTLPQIKDHLPKGKKPQSIDSQVCVHLAHTYILWKDPSRLPSKEMEGQGGR